MAGPLRRFRRAFRFAFRGWRVEDETDDEIRFHLAQRIETLIARGLSRDAAEREALRRFGPYDQGRAQMVAAAQHREEMLTMLERFDSVRHDLGYAFRQIRRAPLFTGAVVGSFALGIGANATMFGIIDRLLLRPPAQVLAPERVYQVGELRQFGGSEHRTTGLSYPAYKDYRDHLSGLMTVATATGTLPVDLGRGEQAQKIQGMLVSASYFTVAGTRPLLGRFFLPEEDREPDGTPVAVIGYGFWQREFVGEPRALGAKLAIGAQRYTIVGVAPRGFTGLQKARVDVFIPITAATGLRFAGANWSTSRGSAWLNVYARLQPKVELAQVEARATAVRRQAPSGDAGSPRDTTLRTSLEPITRSDDVGMAHISKLLIGVSALVLLIACANVASLLVARALRRRREIALRLALGIGRARLVRQLLTESVILAVIGGVAAILVMHWGTSIIGKLLLSGWAWDSSYVDGRVLTYTAIITLATGIFAGVLPAIGAGSADLTRGLREGARDGSPHRSRTRNALLLAQTAFAVVLLAGTGLFIRSLHNVNAIELGMDTRQVLVATMNLRAAGFDTSERQSLFDVMAERVRHISGIASVGQGSALPFSSSYAVYLEIPGVDTMPSLSDGGPYVNAVSPEYFKTLGIRIIRGRGFTSEDDATHARVMVVSESMARLVWRGRDPIGQCVGFDADTLPCTTVIGVAENTHRNSVIENSEVLQYYVLLQHAPAMMGDRILFVRPADGDPDRWMEPVRRDLQTAAPNLPFADVRPMTMLYDWQIRPWREGATMFGIFGALALMLTALGLYSVVAYAVAQRTHEIGVRMALGADRGRVMTDVVGHGVVLALAGTGVGLVIALAAGKFVEPLLFQISPRDPLTFAIVIVVLTVVSILAGTLPALRAARVDPVIALRAD
jgi:predicted permease